MNDSKFRSIVVGVDGKGLSKHAVERAFGLASRFDAHLHFVHALEVYWPMMKAEDMAQAESAALVHAHAEAGRVIQAACNHVGADYPDAEEKLKVLPGPPAKVLLEAAERHAADLIVLGPHAKRSLLDFGSTSRVLLSRAPAPVWTQIGPAEPIQRIVVSTDFSSHNQPALLFARDVAEKLHAELEVAHCYAPPAFAYSGAVEGTPTPTYAVEAEREAAREQLERATVGPAWKSVKLRKTFLEGDPVEELTRLAHEADLLVLGTHGRTGLSRFFLGSVAYAVLKRVDKPVVVVPSAEMQWLLDAHDE